MSIARSSRRDRRQWQLLYITIDERYILDNL